jgi:(1->4)-alpha-D-glucan 1-alpha-D-glucosylmutase
MLATATHDTKRGEDARLRIDTLSEIPGAWTEAVRRWSALNQPLRGDGLPDRNAEYFFYQTLAGAWPLDAGRAWAYLLKAAREAKAYTSWREPDAAYETALQRFVEGALANDAFVVDLERFTARLKALSMPATLAQMLLKLTAPGVPDIYQGCELIDLSLVDPDNRRAVDYTRRRDLLEAASGLRTAADALATRDPDLLKLWLTQRVLQTRRRHAAAFRGGFQPLHAEGNTTLVAFLRGDEVISVAQTRGASTGSLTLPDGAWRNVLTHETLRGGALPVAGLLRELNVALLVRQAS